MNKPKMYYFGPWGEAGHFYHDEHGGSVCIAEEKSIPWPPDEVDCKLQPGVVFDRDGRHRSNGPEIQGAAAIHHRNGWTALAFWDRSVDRRGGSNSTYIAEGEFSFDQMVEMAKTRFAFRWNKMSFPVTLCD